LKGETKHLFCSFNVNLFSYLIFTVLTAASMKFRIVFWDVLPCKIIVNNYFTRQYIPEDNSELRIFLFLCWTPMSLIMRKVKLDFQN